MQKLAGWGQEGLYGALWSSICFHGKICLCSFTAMAMANNGRWWQPEVKATAKASSTCFLSCQTVKPVSSLSSVPFIILPLLLIYLRILTTQITFPGAFNRCGPGTQCWDLDSQVWWGLILMGIVMHRQKGFKEPLFAQGRAIYPIREEHFYQLGFTSGTNSSEPQIGKRTLGRRLNPSFSACCGTSFIVLLYTREALNSQTMSRYWTWGHTWEKYSYLGPERNPYLPWLLGEGM